MLVKCSIFPPLSTKVDIDVIHMTSLPYAIKK